MREDGHHGRGRVQNVRAIGRGRLERHHADLPTCAGLVVNDDGVGIGTAQLVTHTTGKRIGGAAWRETHDDAQRLYAALGKTGQCPQPQQAGGCALYQLSAVGHGEGSCEE